MCSSFPLSFPKERRLHGTFDNVYEDVETVPKFPFVQHSFKSKAAPKSEYMLALVNDWRTVTDALSPSDPYADNGHVVSHSFL